MDFLNQIFASVRAAVSNVGETTIITLAAMGVAILLFVVLLLIKKAKAKRAKETTPEVLLSSKSKDAIQSTQSLIGIKAVIDGILVTKDNRFIKIMEFYPINFILKSAQDQEDIISNFALFLRNAPIKIQLKTLSTKTDVDKIIEGLQKDLEMEENEYTRILLVEYMNFLQEIGMEEGVSRRFFLIFEDDAPISYPKDFESVKERLNRAAAEAVSNINACGNLYISSRNPDSHIMEILYIMLNRKKAETVPFKHHINEVMQRYMDGYGTTDHTKVPYIPTSDIIAPKYIALTDSKYLVVDGKYYSFVYISSDGYNTFVYPSWLSVIINACEGIDVDVFLTKKDASSVMDKIVRNIRMNRSRLNDMDELAAGGKDVEDSIDAGHYLRNGLMNGEDFFYISTLITVCTDSADLLEKRVEILTRTLATYGIHTRVCRFQQEQAFMSTLPLCKLDKSIERKSQRNGLTSDVASVYPFTSYTMCDNDGILLGTNNENQSLVMLNNFNSAVYSNANMSLMGASGKGKTFALQCIALRMRMRGVQVFTIAPLKGHEFKRACLAVGGQYIKISAGSPNCINILEIRKKPKMEGDMFATNKHDSLLANKIQQVKIFFSLLVPDITLEERQIVDTAVMEAYSRKGITTDNRSLEDPNNPGHYKEMPILGDVYDVMAEIPEAKRVRTILQTLVHGSAKAFNQQTNVDLHNKYIVLDISELTKDTLLLGMFVALDYVWDKAKEDITKRKAIILDELWKLIGHSSNNLAAEYVLEIFKIIRGYGGSAICATQDLNDFFALNDGEFGRGIINASSIKMIFGLENDEALRVQECLDLTDKETKAIKEFPRGSALISTNGNNVAVTFKASDLERKLITTDRNDLNLLWRELNGDFQTPETEMLKDILSREDDD